jgi:hypothetical protein
MILRELHLISTSVQRFEDGWCMVSCAKPSIVSQLSKSLSELGYEVLIIKKLPEGQKILFRRRIGKEVHKC